MLRPRKGKGERGLLAMAGRTREVQASFYAFHHPLRTYQYTSLSVWQPIEEVKSSLLSLRRCQLIIPIKAQS